MDQFHEFTTLRFWRRLPCKNQIWAITVLEKKKQNYRFKSDLRQNKKKNLEKSEIIKRNESLISDLQEEVYPCESLNEFRDVAEIMGDIDDDFIKNSLSKYL